MSTPSNEPIAIIGASIVLPANIHNREKFFEIVRDKNQVSVDTVAARRYHASDIDETDSGHPWKLKSKYSMVFTEEEVSALCPVLISIRLGWCVGWPVARVCGLLVGGRVDG